MYFDDIKLGMSVDIAPVTIEKDDMIAFAEKYDSIPLHTDEEYAKTTRFGGLIAPGVMSFMSVWNSYLQNDFAGEELIAGMSTKIEWFKPVFADDVLSGKTTVTKLTKRSERNGIVELTLDIFNQNGVQVIRNVTEALVRCREK